MLPRIARPPASRARRPPCARCAAALIACSSRDAIDTLRPFARQRRGHGVAEPAARAGDHRDLALQTEIHASLRQRNSAADPGHDPIERLPRGRVERRRRAPRGRRWPARRGGAGLPCGSPCRCLPGTRSASTAPRDRTRRRPRRRRRRDTARRSDEDLREREAGHRAGRAGHQLLEQEHAAETAEDPHLGSPACSRMRDVLNGVGGSSSLIVRARGISRAIRASSAGSIA